MANETKTTSSGVQSLINRLRDEGVQSGKEEAERLVEEAREKAAALIREAEEEAAALRDKTDDQIKADHAAALAALQLAARDTALELQSAVVGGFERQVKRLVSTATLEPELLKAVMLVLAGHSADTYIKDKHIQVLASHAVFDDEDDPEVEERAAFAALGIAGDMLREGVELIPGDDIEGGVRVRVVEDDLEIDLTSEAISRLLLRHMLPRFRAILSGEE